VTRSEGLQQHIRKLRLTSRRLIQTFGEGSFRTLFHGRGIEFATLREYVPGDDIRMIEWNTTARRGTPYVKTFMEERDLSVVLAVDLSSSMNLKWDSILRIAAIVTTLASFLDDRIGCLGFTDRIEFYLQPLKKPTQPERILHLLMQPRKSMRKTSLADALAFLTRVLKKHAILFLISDFLDRNFQSAMLPLGKKHEMVGVHLYHPAETGWKTAAVVDAQDPETGRRFLIDGYDKKTRESYARFFDEHQKRITRAFGRANADLLMLPAGPGVELQLIEFLRRRQSARAPLQQVIAAETPNLF
jgi:uncharacterized protein (DUF58 family)